MTKTLRSIIPLSLALIALLSYQFLGATWQPAPADPPLNNTLPPIHTGISASDPGGPTTQAVGGNLITETVWIDNLTIFDEFYLQGNGVGEDKILTSRDEYGYTRWRTPSYVVSKGLPICAQGETIKMKANGNWGCQAVPAASTGSSCPIGGSDLVNCIHTVSDCTGIGGSVYTLGTGEKFCRVSGSCPAGWGQYDGWAAFAGGQGGNNGDTAGCTPNTCSIPSVSFRANAVQPTCGPVVQCRPYNWSATFSGALTEMGCY